MAPGVIRYNLGSGGSGAVSRLPQVAPMDGSSHAAPDVFTVATFVPV